MKYSIHLKYSKCQTICSENVWHLEKFGCIEYFILRNFVGVSSFSGHPVEQHVLGDQAAGRLHRDGGERGAAPGAHPDRGVLPQRREGLQQGLPGPALGSLYLVPISGPYI